MDVGRFRHVWIPVVLPYVCFCLFLCNHPLAFFFIAYFPRAEMGAFSWASAVGCLMLAFVHQPHEGASARLHSNRGISSATRQLQALHPAVGPS